MVDDKDKKERQQAHLRVFNHYFPSWNMEDGCIKQIKEDLEKIKKLDDLEEKYREAHFYWVRHHDNEDYARSKFNSGNLGERGISKLDTIDKYHNLVKELWDLNIELIRQTQQSSTDNNQTNNRERERERQTQQQKQINESSQQSEICSGHGCLKEIPTNQTYFYNPKNPQIKLCSQNCYTNYYGELCYKCKNTFLKENLYAPIKGNSCYLLCSDCYQKYQQEEKERNRKFCFKCSAELTEFNNKKPPFSLCDFCFEKDLERAEREARVEREKRNAKNKPELIGENNLVNNQANELKSQISQLESSPNPNQNLLNSKKEELRELEKRLNQENVQVNDNSKLYLGIGLGSFGISLISLVAWLFVRNRKRG